MHGSKNLVKTLMGIMFVAVVIGFSFICCPQVHALNLWTRGTPVEGDDGNIVFWQTWQNAQEKFKVHDITYRSDGNNVKAWILEPKSEGPHPVMLYCRGGGGTSPIKWWAVYNQADGPVANLYQRDMFRHAEAGMIVVATNFRDTGMTVAQGGPAYNPSSTTSSADQSSGSEDPFQPSGLNQDPMVGDEVNDAINLLPLIQKLASSEGNGGINIAADIERVFLFGHSMGGARAMAVLRELSDAAKYGALPAVRKVAVRGLITDFVSWYNDMASGRTVFSYPSTPAVISARNTGNFDLIYPNDYTRPSSRGYSFYSLFADGVPQWDYSNPDSDQWTDLGTTSPPAYPVGQLYGEEIYYRSSIMWDQFWAANTIPVLILFGKGDTQILWGDGKALYDKMIAQGDANLYQLSLYEDAPENGPECAFLGENATRNCDHWLVAQQYGAEAIQAWWGIGE